MLLPTILSRCLQFTFKPLKEYGMPKMDQTIWFTEALKKVVLTGGTAEFVASLKDKESSNQFARFVQKIMRDHVLGITPQDPALSFVNSLSAFEAMERFDAALEIENQLRSNANYGLMVESFLRRKFDQGPRGCTVIKLIDTHAHLNLLKHRTAQSALERARSAGVSPMISVSTDPTSLQVNAELGRSNPDVFYTLGVHPHGAMNWRNDRDTLLGEFDRDPSGHPKCVAIGEIGLDFHDDCPTAELQVEAFEDQLELAKSAGLPVIIHCRDAFDELFQMIKNKGLPARGAVMHCFTGGPKEARAALDLGMKISFSGVVTFKNAKPIQEAARQIPRSEILIETDCPFLAPTPFRGQPNEPAFLVHTAQYMAQLLAMPLEEFGELTTKNAVEFFALA